MFNCIFWLYNKLEIIIQRFIFQNLSTCLHFFWCEILYVFSAIIGIYFKRVYCMRNKNVMERKFIKRDKGNIKCYYYELFGILVLYHGKENNF